MRLCGSDRQPTDSTLLLPGLRAEARAYAFTGAHRSASTGRRSGLNLHGRIAGWRGTYGRLSEEVEARWPRVHWLLSLGARGLCRVKGLQPLGHICAVGPVGAHSMATCQGAGFGIA
jgi:hypothetical protein